jgi:hypothetical protein
MTVMLENRTELVVDLLLDILRGDYDDRAAATLSISLVSMGLVVLLEPNVLVKPAEGKGQLEGMAYSCGGSMGEFFFVCSCNEVIFKLVYCKKALEAGVHVAVVRVVLESNYSFRELGEKLHSLLHQALLFYS